MKEGWEYKKLGDVCEIYQPKTIASSLLKKDGQYPVFGANGMIGRYDNYNHEDSEVLLCCRGATCGAINVSLPFSWINGNAMVVRPQNGSFLKSFLRYLLLTLDYSHIITGAAQPQITRASISPVTVPVPSIIEQQSIVDYLDSAFAKIDAMKANAEKALNEAKALFQASLKEMLEPKEGWEEDALINVFKFIDYRGATPKKLQSGVPLLTAKNVKYGYIDYTIKDFISQEEYETRKGRGISRKGDLLFTTEAPLGNVAIADLEEYSAGQRLITLQQYDNPKYEFINDFYYYYMLSSHFQNRVMELATGATAQGIKAKLLKTIIVPIPTLTEQQSIVATLDSLKSKVDRLKANYEKISKECDALKQALLKEVFEG